MLLVLKKELQVPELGKKLTSPNTVYGARPKASVSLGSDSPKSGDFAGSINFKIT